MLTETGQTYEGGIAADPGLEAHGAYTFCGLACLCILGEASKMIQKYILQLRHGSSVTDRIDLDI